MNSYRQVVHSARESIDSYFRSYSVSPEPEIKRHRPVRCRKPSVFEVTENIYSAEKSLAMQQIPLVHNEGESAKRPHLRIKKSFEKKYSEGKLNTRTASSYSPRKPVLPSRVVRSFSRQALEAFSSPSRRSIVSPEETRHQRSAQLHNLIGACAQARETDNCISLIRREAERDKRSRSHISLTARTLQQLDAPCELLESMYYLRRGTDAAIKQDAIRMVFDEKTNADSSASQIKLMILRNAVQKRKSRYLI
jgi:hypothetical protein